MIVRLTIFRYDPARHQEVAQLSERQLLPAFRRLPGFRRATTAMDRDAGSGVSITEWDDLQAAQGLREGIGPALMQAIADAGVQLDAPQFYEIVAQT